MMPYLILFSRALDRCVGGGHVGNHAISLFISSQLDVYRINVVHILYMISIWLLSFLLPSFLPSSPYSITQTQSKPVSFFFLLGVCSIAVHHLNMAVLWGISGVRSPSNITRSTSILKNINIKYKYNIISWLMIQIEWIFVFHSPLLLLYSIMLCSSQ